MSWFQNWIGFTRLRTLAFLRKLFTFSVLVLFQNFMGFKSFIQRIVHLNLRNSQLVLVRFGCCVLVLVWKNLGVKLGKRIINSLINTHVWVFLKGLYVAILQLDLRVESTPRLSICLAWIKRSVCLRSLGLLIELWESLVRNEVLGI